MNEDAKSLAVLEMVSTQMIAMVLSVLIKGLNRRPLWSASNVWSCLPKSAALAFEILQVVNLIEER